MYTVNFFKEKMFFICKISVHMNAAEILESVEDNLLPNAIDHCHEAESWHKHNIEKCKFSC